MTGTAGALRAAFESGRTRPMAWRKAQLRALARAIHHERPALIDALAADLGRPAVEAWMTDLAPPAAEAAALARSFHNWVSPTRVRVPIRLQPGRAWVRPEPKGAALILAPWNYPVQLTLQPLAAALAAGNAVAIKPSELAPATAAALATLVERHLDTEAIRVVQGGPEIASELLAERWDHIFFTGGAAVGRLVLRAAAEHLTPVTLELGGKSPAVVTASADVASAARRVAWGKFLNAGQTCVAPDYVVVHRSIAEAFVQTLCGCLTDFYGPDPHRSPDYGRIVNERHVRRLAALLAGRGDGRTVAGGRTASSTGRAAASDGGGGRVAAAGRIVTGGHVVEQDRYVAPTVLDGIGWDDPIMAEEIFGPILPVLTFDDTDDLVATLNGRPEPLALYVFADDPTARRLVARVRSGGAAINTTVLQIAVPDLPFGGVGASGMGAYHGRAGFDTFSQNRGVYLRHGNADPPVLFPPYGRLKAWALRRLLSDR